MIFTILGRRWFEKVNGNTYHSTTVYKNGKFLDKVDFTYGYGSQFEQTGLELIKKHHPRIYKAASKKAGHDIYNGYTLSRYSPHKIVVDVVDVARKKDL